MKPSPNPSEKPKNLGRKAPRRHVDPPDNISAGYDSVEFPVLLRMPELVPDDIAEENKLAAQATVVSAEPRPTEAKPAPSEPPPTPSSSHHRSHSKHSHKPKEKNWTTGKSSRLFWSALAPKVAIGGMLLSITALCVVVLQGPGTEDAQSKQPTQWAADEDSSNVSNDQPDDLVTPIPAPVRPYSDEPFATSSADHTVASKPGSPRPATTAVPDFAQPELAIPKPSAKAAPAADSRSSEGWPTDANPLNSSANSLPSKTTSFQAEGWPDDLEGDPSEADMELELNPAIRAAMRQRAAASRGGNVRPDARLDLQRDAGSAQLNGTVEIPNPQSEFLKLR